METRNMILTWRNFVQETHGATLVWSAILIVMLLGFCGLAIDVGHYVLVKNELQRAADAGALAGVRALFPADPKTATWPVVPDCSTAVTVASQVVHWNKTDQAPTVVADANTGHWDASQRTFNAGCSADNATFTNAVKVTTHREDTPLFLMQVLGAVPKTISATSIAAKLPVGGLRAGKGFPVAVGLNYVCLNTPDFFIPLNNDPNDKGCWWTPEKPVNADKLKALIETPETSMPALEIHNNTIDPIYLDNGVINTALNAIKDNCITNKIVYLPVVNEIKFNQNTEIVNFVEFTITSVTTTGKQGITGNMGKYCDIPGDVADNSFNPDYTTLLLKPAQLVY
jgi:Flp pilus assembly protein TadG